MNKAQEMCLEQKRLKAFIDKAEVRGFGKIASCIYLKHSLYANNILDLQKKQNTNRRFEIQSDLLLFCLLSDCFG